MTIAKLIQVDRATHELRCGRAVNIDGTSFIHPEFIDSKSLGHLQQQDAFLIVTKQRAKAIWGIDFSCAQQINLKELSLDDLQFLIAGQKKGNITSKNATSPVVQPALELARIAQLLPCAILSPAQSDEFKISTSDINSYQAEINQSLGIVSTAPLKLCDAKTAQIKAFRSSNGAAEHMAIIIGKLTDNPLIRIHSSCYTGDLLGSLACDCGDQLRGAIKLIDEDFQNHNGGGIILYLMQEGRGIGLVNKLHAYELQAKAGLDTVEANKFLGFEDEERSFEAAAVMLKKLGVKKVRVITNNPKKINGLEALGIPVTERVPMVIRHEHNHAYLEIKSSKSGHII